jgi:hypothetical protein
MAVASENGHPIGRAGFFCITDTAGRYWTGRRFSPDRAKARTWERGADPYAHAKRAADRMTESGASVEVTFCRYGSMRT